LWNLNNIIKDPNSSGLIKTVQGGNQAGLYFHALCLIEEDTFAAGSHSDINIYKLIQSIDVVFQKKLVDHGGDVNSMQVTSNKEILISVSDDKTSKAWSVASGECLRTFSGHNYGVQGLVLLSERLLATSGGEIKFWSLNSDVCLKTVETERGGLIAHLGVTQDLKIFSCGGGDNKVKIYKF